MAKNQRKRGPSDPAAARAANALARGEEISARRASARSPVTWGVSPDQLNLASANDVLVKRKGGRRSEVLNAQRLDAFESLFRTVTRGEDGALKRALDDAQHEAAKRYARDVAMSGGVMDNDDGGGDHVHVDKGPNPDGSILHKILATYRVQRANESLGRASARLMQALVSPPDVEGRALKDRATPRTWRDIVREMTGETDPKAQASRVRGVAQDLAEFYPDFDREERDLRRLRQAANDNGDRGPEAA